MFTPAEREQVRKVLVESAHADDDVVGAALVGSAATGREDAWSDIDLVLQVRRDADPAEVASRWTAQLYHQHGAAHHLDGTQLWSRRLPTKSPSTTRDSQQN